MRQTRTVSMRSAGADRAAGPRARRGSMRREHTTSRMRCESARGDPAGGSWPSCSAHRLAATSRFLTTASSHMYRLLGLWSSYADADWTGRHRTTSCVCPSIQRRHPTIRSPAKGTEGFTSMWPRRSYETFSQARPYLASRGGYWVIIYIWAGSTHLHELP